MLFILFRLLCATLSGFVDVSAEDMLSKTTTLSLAIRDSGTVRHTMNVSMIERVLMNASYQVQCNKDILVENNG